MATYTSLMRTQLGKHCQRRRCPMYVSLMTNKFKTTAVTRRVHACHNKLCMSGSPSVSNIQSVPSRQLAETILQKSIEKDVMNRCIPLSQVIEDVKELLSLGLSSDRVLEISQRINDLAQLSQVRKLTNQFYKFGFNKDDVVSIFLNCMNILNMKDEDVANSLITLQQSGFSSEALVKMVKHQPAILEHDIQKVDLRISELKQLFKSSDTLTLITNNPSLIFCDMSHIHDRFNYVFHEMGITQRQMMYSKLFTYPMEHIHARHMFVVRAGFFKKVKSKDAQINTNPTLDKILDPSDKEFARQFGGMSEADYNAFKKLLLREHIILRELDNEYEESGK